MLFKKWHFAQNFHRLVKKIVAFAELHKTNCI